MAARAEDKTGARKVYKDHNLHLLFGVNFGVNFMALLGVASITRCCPG